MKLFAAALASLFVGAAASAQAQQPDIGARRLLPEDVRAVAPALEKYTQERLYGEVWNRPGLSPRDRSIVTVAALIARDLSLPMNYYFGRALDNGVKPRELSEIITHLAFYSGWPMLSPPSGRRKMCSPSATSAWTRSRPPRRRFCRSTKQRRPIVQRASVRSLARSHRDWCSTPPTLYFAISGCVPTSHRGIVAW
jgi:alkylhydroperoxidase/carboxymuconolactone decarboxylase family protein YurZ